jgi:hypothetical protein
VTRNLTPEEFDAEFDVLWASAYRLEAQPAYHVAGEAALREAMQRGAPRPVRSIRNNRWLARIARTVLASEVQWTRTRVVDNPPTDYQRQQLETAYLESQTAGEEILVVRRDDLPANPGGDFWLLDEDTKHARAILMRYDADGRWLAAELTTLPEEIAQLKSRRRWIDAAAVPLNAFVAGALDHV